MPNKRAGYMKWLWLLIAALVLVWLLHGFYKWDALWGEFL